MERERGEIDRQENYNRIKDREIYREKGKQLDGEREIDRWGDGQTEK